MEVGDAEAVTVGLEIVLIVMVFVEKQPAAFAPVTVYVVLIKGLTVTIDPVNTPGFHV
jgi:hypothetical protein